MTTILSFLVKQVAHHTMLSEGEEVPIKTEPGPPGLMLNLAMPVFRRCKNLYHFRRAPSPTMQSSRKQTQTQVWLTGAQVHAWAQQRCERSGSG